MPNVSPTLTARPTVYRGIQMRSRLEARYAAWLDKIGAKWEYEPGCFADETGQYLPDFLVRQVHVLSEQRNVYVEVKPTPQQAAAVVDDRRMERIWSTDAAPALAVEAPGLEFVYLSIAGVGSSYYQWIGGGGVLGLMPWFAPIERTWTGP